MRRSQTAIPVPDPAIPDAAAYHPQRDETATIVRNEFKYDLFRSDLPEVMRLIEREYDEIRRPMPTTLTVFFYSSRFGAPEVETQYRLRAYGHVDDPAAVTLDELEALTWRVEKKHGHRKERLGTFAGLPKRLAADDESWDIAGIILRPNMLKVTQRRHFALTQVRDEAHRLTVDLSRNVFKFGEKLQNLGEMGPRVEVKLPLGSTVDSVALEGRLRATGHWTPFAGLAHYFQFLLRHQLPPETHMSLPEIEAKYVVTDGRSDQVFDDLIRWLHAKQVKWRPLLPSPHTITRARRYHVCEGLGPDSSATVVETAAGRCSLKIKDAARRYGSLLIRDTTASHTTDLDGAMTTPEAFIRSHGLTRITEFTKYQRKIPIALDNGHSYQFSLDNCTDPAGRHLAQLEIEYIGSTDGRVVPIKEIAVEIDDIARELRSSPFGAALERSYVAKHAFFSERATT